MCKVSYVYFISYFIIPCSLSYSIPFKRTKTKNKQTKKKKKTSSLLETLKQNSLLTKTLPKFTPSFTQLMKLPLRSSS